MTSERMSLGSFDQRQPSPWAWEGRRPSQVISSLSFGDWELHRMSQAAARQAISSEWSFIGERFPCTRRDVAGRSIGLAKSWDVPIPKSIT
jgi:hypothetical protein